MVDENHIVMLFFTIILFITIHFTYNILTQNMIVVSGVSQSDLLSQAFHAIVTSRYIIIVIVTT